MRNAGGQKEGLVISLTVINQLLTIQKNNLNKEFCKRVSPHPSQVDGDE